jgi:hypothetical protein
LNPSSRPVREVLIDLRDLLRKHRVTYVSEVEGALAASNGRDLALAARHLIGGMGSLTDVYITAKNGHEVTDEAQANRTLEALRQELWRAVAGPV